MAVTCWVGCGDSKPTALSSRAPAQRDFPDNELLAYVPDDTPYAFATFEPFPLEFLDRASEIYKPLFARALRTQGEDTKLLRALADEIGTFSVHRFEELGFSSKARIVLYGVGVFPVVRIEVRDGDALLAFARRVAQRMSYTLPAPIEEQGRKVWRIEDGDSAFLIVLAKSEVVFALAPAALPDWNRALIVGTRKPARSLRTERFREIARRHGYSAHLVGFFEFPRLVTSLVALAGAEAPAPTCTSAIVAFAKRVPRMTLGYDEITGKRVSAGMVIELAPDVLADVQTLTTSVAGLERLRGEQPLIAIAAAADLSRARELASRATSTVGDLASACTSDELAQLVRRVDAALSRPVPVFLEGMRGGVAALTALGVTPNGAKRIEGWAVMSATETAPLLAMASRELPGLGLAPDGIARPLPEAFGVPGAIAASRHAISVALGDGSESIATELVHGMASRAPLLLFELDLKRIYDAMAALGSRSDDNAEDAVAREMAKVYGPISLTIDVDDRGLVGRSSFELR